MEKVPYTFETAVLKYPEETKGLVSVIIPMYNCERYIKEALDSVSAQTFENWEAILVNDGSTDNTEQICKEYAKKDLRFKYISKENGGTLLARKTGLENSKGEFIANLDGDDIYLPCFLEKMVEKIKEENSDFVCCNFEDSDTRKISAVENCNFGGNKLQIYLDIREHEGCFLWNKLIRRSIYADVLFPYINLTYGEDDIQVLQIIYHGKPMGFITECLYRYRNGSEISTTKTNKLFSKHKRLAQRVSFAIAIYLLTKRFFGPVNAENIFVDTFGKYFAVYFLLGKRNSARQGLEYAENFVSDFLKGLEKSNIKNLNYLLLLIACKGFTLPFVIYGKIISAVFRIMR